MRIRYHCHFGQLTGYGRAAHDYLLALSRASVELDIRPLSAYAPSFFELEPRYGELREHVRPLDGVDIEIYHTTPARLTTIAKAREEHLDTIPAVAYTTWETYDLPEDLQTGLNSFDAVITPSEFCKVAMQMPEAIVLPHCYDPDFWRPRLGRDPDAPFTFYALGAWGARKNHLGVIQAYLHAFRRSDPVRLVISAQDADVNAVRLLLHLSGLPEGEWPSLHITDPAVPMTQEDLLELHRGADCFVSATRGEGFGLGHFEAAVLGKPIITPMFGGQEEFLPKAVVGKGERAGEFWRSDDACMVEAVSHQLTPVFPEPRLLEQIGGAVRAVAPAPTGTSCRQLWAEPDLHSLADAMSDTLADHERGDIDSARPAWLAPLEEHFADYRYERIAPELISTLEEIAT